MPLKFRGLSFKLFVLIAIPVVLLIGLTARSYSVVSVLNASLEKTIHV